jgi:ADP-ribose pyrophosphatase YjhB (NUDIX family)
MLPDDLVDAPEMEELLASADDAVLETLDVEIDAELYTNRFVKANDRRGEVVFAIRGPGGGTLVHRKAFYAEGIFRLPSGGINHGEPVLQALRREVREETGLAIAASHFLGVQDCRMRYNGFSVRFVSYIFHIHRTVGQLRIGPGENITEFREVSAGGLAEIAELLRREPPPWSGWGRWRALAHDRVHRHLVQDAGGRE